MRNNPLNAVHAGNLLARLKAETLSRHLAIEQELDLTSEALNLPAYRTILEKFFGFYEPVERLFAAIGGPTPGSGSTFFFTLPSGEELG